MRVALVDHSVHLKQTFFSKGVDIRIKNIREM